MSKQIRAVKAHYDKVSSRHILYRTNIYALEEDAMYARIFSPYFEGSNLAVLDIGCGFGLPQPIWEMALPHIGHYTGVDLSPRMLSLAKNILSKEIADGKVQLHQDDLLHFLTTLEDECYDRITAVHGVLSLNERSKLGKILSESHRVVKKGGYNIIDMINRKPGMKRFIADYKNRLIKTDSTTQVYTYNSRELNDILTKSGFEVVTMKGLNVFGASVEAEQYFVTEQQKIESAQQAGDKSAQEKLTALHQRARSLIEIDYDICTDDLRWGHSLITFARRPI